MTPLSLFIDSTTNKMMVAFGEVPKEPRGMNYYAGINQDDVDHYNKSVEEYNSAIASLKASAIECGNPEEAALMLHRQVPTTYEMAYGLHPITARVEIRTAIRVDVYQQFEKEVPVKLAYLYPISGPVEKVESQEEMWAEVELTLLGPAAQLFDAKEGKEWALQKLKKHFTLTRNK